MPSLVDDYLAWALVQKRRSAATITAYRRTLLAVFETLDPAVATVDDIEAWWMQMSDYAPATQNQALAAVRSFYKWAMRFDRVGADPSRRIDPPKVDIKVPRPIGKTDLGKLLTAARADSPEMARALALGAYAGLRVSEVAALDWADIDMDARRMYVTGKGRKQRAVAVSVMLLDEILPNTGGNVVTAGGKPYSADTLGRRVNRFMDRYDVAHTSHDLRKRGATRALASGASPAAVAEMFGWADLNTALHYAVVGDEELDKIAAAMV